MKKLVLILALLLNLSSIAFGQTSRVSNKNSSLTVNAGTDQTITLPDPAILSGSVIALPKRTAVTMGWAATIAPGSVVFSPANAASSTATFSVPGTYILTLSSSTTRLSTSSKVTITVNAKKPPPSGPAPVTITIASTSSPKLFWNAVANTTGYNLYRSTTSGVFSGSPVNGSFLIMDTAFLDNSVVVGTTYYYAVRSVASGVEGPNSNVITFTAH